MHLPYSEVTDVHSEVTDERPVDDHVLFCNQVLELI
jgi:hypothetical protein